MEELLENLHNGPMKAVTAPMILVWNYFNFGIVNLPRLQHIYINENTSSNEENILWMAIIVTWP